MIFPPAAFAIDQRGDGPSLSKEPDQSICRGLAHAEHGCEPRNLVDCRSMWCPAQKFAYRIRSAARSYAGIWVMTA